ncbi:nucleotidyltransferase family protein [Zoogloea sp.]|uniref:nucleotidyltransferase family protein n=1 Tax=Zoogloea sp. TaxID=49181 RepID=UPI00321FF224
MGPIIGVLLAAGQGRRFGSDKLLHPLEDGTPMAVLAARRLKAACPGSIAVLRPEQTALADLLAEEGVQPVFCAAARGGMGHSLAAGVAASPATAGGWLVALGDMPFIQPQTMRQVARVLEAGASLAAPWLHGRRGHPVGFAACWRETLLAQAGDAGARDILSRHPEALRRIDTDDEGVLRDVDVPGDLGQA